MRLGWSHIVMFVRDMEMMTDFYTNTLGFMITDRGPIGDNEIVFMSQSNSDHHQVGFANVRKDRERSNTVAHIAFRVEALNDVRSFNKRLLADGRGSTPKTMCHGNAWSIYFDDPEGNTIEIFTDTPWHVKQPQGGAWDIDASDEEVIASTRKKFESEPEFKPIDDFYQSMETWLRERP
jgi:catechol-2,3-dioxygenase